MYFHFYKDQPVTPLLDRALRGPNWSLDACHGLSWLTGLDSNFWPWPSAWWDCWKLSSALSISANALCCFSALNHQNGIDKCFSGERGSEFGAHLTFFSKNLMNTYLWWVSLAGDRREGSSISFIPSVREVVELTKHIPPPMMFFSATRSPYLKMVPLCFLLLNLGRIQKKGQRHLGMARALKDFGMSVSLSLDSQIDRWGHSIPPTPAVWSFESLPPWQFLRCSSRYFVKKNNKLTQFV